MGRFPSRTSPGKQPIKKRGIKRFLIIEGKFYMQRSRTPRLVERSWVPILGASRRLFGDSGPEEPERLLTPGRHVWRFFREGGP